MNFMEKISIDQNCILGEKNDKGMHLYCTNCHTYHEINYHLKLGNTFKCPNCKKKYKYVRKKYSHRALRKNYQLCIFTKYKGLIITRYFTVNKAICINDSDYSYSFFEYNRSVLNCPAYIENRPASYKRWSPDVYSTDNSFSRYYGYWENKCHIYKKGLKNILKDTEYKYSFLWMINTIVSPRKYLHESLLFPEKEMLLKAGFENLAIDFYRSREQGYTLNYLLKHRDLLNQLKPINPRFDQITFAVNTNIFNAKSIEKLSEKIYLNSKKFNEVLEFIITKTRFTKKQLINYLVSDKFNMKSLNDYDDYLNTVEKTGGDLNSSAFIFPKVLSTAHDEAHDKLKIIESEKYEILYQKRKADLYKYRMDYNRLMIFPPEHVYDLINEGKVLHHCVSSYMSKLAEAKTNIMFIRKKESPNEPYVTLEFTDNKVVQVQGIRNNIPIPLEKSVKSFVKKWANENKLDLNIWRNEDE